MDKPVRGAVEGGRLARVLPFTLWFRGYRLADLRVDLLAGLTVALVLIPQSMAYAQLAGLPAFYGLYAAFLPPMIAALFGSSRQLATGPVAVVSLMTAASLEPLATAGSEAFIAYAVLLALVVGVFQLTLGLLRMGIIVNFLSHPVVNGFTNAAALIIASSQLSKLFGVHVDKAEHHYETIWRVLVAAVRFTHWPTLGLAVLALTLMYGLKKISPRIPFVLVAVVVTTVISWASGFEHDIRVPLPAIQDVEIRQAVRRFNKVIDDIAATGKRRAEVGQRLYDARERHGDLHKAVLDLSHEQQLLTLTFRRLQDESHVLRKTLRGLYLHGVERGSELSFYRDGKLPAGARDDGRHWRLKVGNRRLDEAKLVVEGGGAVVGVIPRGLPTLSAPRIDLKTVLQFLPLAAIISLLGFMEAISIAKAMAARTGQRLDPNQELIGQGLGNIIGSFGQSYPVSGSFSRSAVNIGAGAVSGMSSVFTSLVVVVTLLLLTPLLYHLPQSVLAAVIMMAVIGLVNVRGFIHAYRAQRYDGIIALITFACTLAFAPHLDRGIMIGVVLSIGNYLYRNSRPSVAPLSLHPDYSLRDALRHGLRQCERVAVIRFSESLFFANASYLEDQINEQIQRLPGLRHVLLPANSINEVDASGEEALSLIIDRVRNRGLDISFSGINEQVLDLFRRTHLLEKIGEDHLFPTQFQAIRAIHDTAHQEADEQDCPLLRICHEVPGEEPRPGKYRILVVDDEADFAAYLSKRLRRKGMAVSVCTDPMEALPLMERTYHEVLLMDVRMPKLSGVDLLREVHTRWPNAQVIMLTGHGTSEQAFELGHMGAFELLTKPCDMDRLIRTINNAVITARVRVLQESRASNEPGA